MSLDRITFSTLLWRHATSLPHLQIAANDEEGEGSGNSRTCVFPIKWHMFFQVDVGQVKSIRSLLTGSKSNIWTISSGLAIRQVMALCWKNTNQVDISRWMTGCVDVFFSARMRLWQRR